jgi:serine/threonine protein kinase
VLHRYLRFYVLLEFSSGWAVLYVASCVLLRVSASCFLAMLSAVVYLHEHWVLHRDLKVGFRLCHVTVLGFNLGPLNLKN